MRLILAILLLSASSVVAQPEPKKPPPDPVAPEVVLIDLRAAYSKPTAEEVTVRFRPQTGSGLTERTDTLVIRMDPGEPGHQPRSVLLELGALRIHLGGGKLTAINTSVNDKFYQRSYPEPLTIAKLAELLPPLPLPQLAIVLDGDKALRSPIAQLTDIKWEPATWDDLARPPMVVMKGAGATGTAEFHVNVQTRRVMKFIATIKRGAAEGTYDLTCRAIEGAGGGGGGGVGDPAKWAIPTEGRQSVASLADLKPTIRPMATLQVGEAVPKLSLSHQDLTAWQLHDALTAAKPEPVAIILFRAGKQMPDSTLRDARAGLAALRTLHAHSAAAAVIDITDYTRDRMTQLRQTWNPLPDANPIGADDLLWSANAAQGIDRFSAAAAVIVVIRSDMTLAGVVSLDGRAEKAEEVAAEVKKAIGK